MAEVDVVLQRQWDLLKALTRTETGLTLTQLAEMFNVSEKTIKRDVKSVEVVFGKLKTRNEAHGRKRYLYDQSPFSFGLALDRNELLAIYIGQTLMTPLKGTYFWDGIQSGREKIKKILREDTVKYAERVAPFFYQFEPNDRRQDPQVRRLTDEALKAMEESRVLSISYRSLSSDRVKQYEIHPYNFVYWRNSVYLVGYCCRDRKIKIWKVDRLSDAEALPKRFKRFDFDVDSYLANAIEPFVGDSPVVRALVRFSGSAARIVQEERLRAVRAIRKESEDSVVLEMDAEVGPSFIRWVMGFGARAEILDPPHLRENFLREVEDLRVNYLRRPDLTKLATAPYIEPPKGVFDSKPRPSLGAKEPKPEFTIREKVESPKRGKKGDQKSSDSSQPPKKRGPGRPRIHF